MGRSQAAERPCPACVCSSHAALRDMHVMRLQLCVGFAQEAGSVPLPMCLMHVSMVPAGSRDLKTCISIHQTLHCSTSSESNQHRAAAA